MSDTRCPEVLDSLQVQCVRVPCHKGMHEAMVEKSTVRWEPKEAADARPMWNREEVQRVLWTIVTRYYADRPNLPNELMDDAIRIGKQTLIDNHWWENE